MRRAFSYKAKISPSVARNAEAQLRLCCELYNAAIQERRDAWRMCRKSVGRFEQDAQLKFIRKDRPEFAAIGSQVLGDVLSRVALAYDAFFRRLKAGQTPGYPRFKPWQRYDSLTFRRGCGWKLNGDRVTMQGIGTFRLRLSRPILGTIKTVTLRRDAVGDWFVTFSCDDVPQNILPDTRESIGVDVGLASFLTTSNGELVGNPRHFRTAQAKLARAGRRVSKRRKGSNRRRKAVRVLARHYRTVQRQRRDFHFKTARSLVQKYDHIAIEDLNVRGLSRGMLAKSVNDAGWSQFIEALRVKAEEAGRVITAVNPSGTSQVCSGCGCEPRVRKTLSVRVHHCPECGLTIDRDWNAAINILHLAEKVRAEPSASEQRSRAAA